MKIFPCGLCGEIEFRQLLQRKDKYKQAITLVVCTKCGLQRLNPRFEGKEEEAFYSSEYYQLYGMGKKKDETPHWVARKNTVAKEILDAVETHRPLSGTRLLDIGCGYGFLLRNAKERGAIVSGVELSKEAGEVLQAEGYSIFIGKLTEFLFKNPEPFGVITLSHVLEHVGEPIPFLMSIKSLLEPDGILCAEVPNTTWHTEFGRHPLSTHSAHLYYHTERTLRAVFQLSGLQVLETTFGMDGGAVRVTSRVGEIKILEDIELDDPGTIEQQTLESLRFLHPPLFQRVIRYVKLRLWYAKRWFLNEQ